MSFSFMAQRNEEIKKKNGLLGSADGYVSTQPLGGSTPVSGSSGPIGAHNPNGSFNQPDFSYLTKNQPTAGSASTPTNPAMSDFQRGSDAFWNDPTRAENKPGGWNEDRNYTTAPGPGREPIARATNNTKAGGQLTQQAPEVPQASSQAMPMPKEASIRHQLDQILDPNSKLMQRAATQGVQHANQRGLLNSSMAADASMGAMIDRAAPIAGQEAANQLQWGSRERGFEQDQIMMQLDEGMRGRMMEMDHSFQSMRQNDALAAGLWNQGMQSIGLALNNPNMTPEQQNRAIKMIIDNLGSGMDFVSSMRPGEGGGGGSGTGGGSGAGGGAGTGGGTGAGGSQESPAVQNLNFDKASTRWTDMESGAVPIDGPKDIDSFAQMGFAWLQKSREKPASTQRKHLERITKVMGPEGLGLILPPIPDISRSGGSPPPTLNPDGTWTDGGGQPQDGTAQNATYWDRAMTWMDEVTKGWRNMTSSFG
jgi:hypothetical protein